MPPPPPPSGQLWYVARGGQRFGPMLYNQLAHLFQSNQLFPGDFCWTEGMSAWIPVSQIFGIERMAAWMPVSGFGGTTRSTEISPSPVAAPNPVEGAVAFPKPAKAAPLPSSAEIKKATRWCLIIGLIRLGGAIVIAAMVGEGIVSDLAMVDVMLNGATALYALGVYVTVKAGAKRISGLFGGLSLTLGLLSVLGILVAAATVPGGSVVSSIGLYAAYVIWKGRTSAKQLGR